MSATGGFAKWGRSRKSHRATVGSAPTKMPNRFGLRRAAGVTTTEVVVASALLIIAIVPILKALTGAFVTTRIVERKTRSLMLAQAKLDEIKARSIYHYSDTFTESNSAFAPPSADYLCNVTDSTVSGNLRKITVSVGYDLNGNSSLEDNEIKVTLATLIARRF